MGLFSFGDASLKQMEKEYAQHLGDAFRRKWELRRNLLTAVRQFHDEAFAEAQRNLDALWKFCETNEDHQAVLLFSGLCRSRSGDKDGAIAVYKRLLRYAPDYSTALSNLGLLLMDRGDYVEAEKYLVAAEKNDRRNAYAKHNLGTLYYRMGDYEKAITHCTAAFLHNQSLYQACTTVSLSAMAMGDLSLSRRCAKMAVDRGQSELVLRRALREIAARQYQGAELSAENEKLLKEWCRRTGRKSNLLYVFPEPVGRSYIGGPSLGEPPLDGNGRPMRQLCALYCEEFTNVPLMPHEGLLRIYIAEDETMGLDIEHPNVQSGFRVLYDREYGHLIPGKDPGPSELFPVKGCYGIRPAAVGNQPMPMEDYRFDRDFAELLTELGRGELDDEEAEVLNVWLHPSGHRMGGYPWFTQWDPREREEYRKYDTLLFQLDNMDFGDMDIFIGDEGVMNFFIPEENLKRLDFSDVLYWWDCC